MLCLYLRYILKVIYIALYYFKRGAGQRLSLFGLAAAAGWHHNIARRSRQGSHLIPLAKALVDGLCTLTHI